MKQTEQPLYPKLSSIYNKILQLVIAIIFLVILMNVWLMSRDTQRATINEHAREIGAMYLSQAATTAKMQLSSEHAYLQRYADELAGEALVHDVHIYDASGFVIVSSSSAESINDLYGISPQKKNRTDEFFPLVQELRAEKLQGYIRLSFNRELLIERLEADSLQQYDLMRVMMIIAGLVGFLLTRGLNRFSRQGFRLAK